jgi:hypothetical protein
MFRKLVCTVVAFAFFTMCLVAADFTGKVKTYKKGENKGDPACLTVTGKDKDQDVFLGKGYKLFDSAGAEIKGKERGKALKDLVGKEVTVKTEKKDDKEMAVEVKIK